jgi:hypothetical protein
MATQFPVVAAAQPSGGSLQAATSSQPAAPQPSSSPTWYFGATALFSNTSDGTTNCPYVCGQLGGWTVGGGFSVGGHLTRSVGLEGEVSTGTALEAPGIQRTSNYLESGGRTFTARHWPTILSLSARVAGFRSYQGKSTVEVVGGLALEVAHQSQVDGVDVMYQNGQLVSSVPALEASDTKTAIGFGGGVDFVPMVRDRLALTIGGRIYWFARGDYNDTEIVPLPGPLTVQLRVGLRWLR